jgi:5'-nucleotidase
MEPSAPPRPRILLTNDDGIAAPGLEALYLALRDWADIEIVAPDSERSAVGHSVTIFRDMAYRRVERDGRPWGHALDATPADCVKLALTRLLDKKPDLVIAGVNPGANLGRNVFYSGTVAAARETGLLGVPAIAVSLHVTWPHPTTVEPFAAAAAFAARLAPLVIAHGLPPGVILNVNVPDLPADAIAGVAVARQGGLFITDLMEPLLHEGGVRGFRNVGDRTIPSEASDDELDDLALARGCITVTPLQTDLTHHASLAELTRWFEARGPGET